jgi:hypothetical protein
MSRILDLSPILGSIPPSPSSAPSWRDRTLANCPYQPEPKPFSPPEPKPRHSYGSFTIDYDFVIHRAFTSPPNKPTIAWLLYRNIYYEHPERITVVADPHQNNSLDRTHISLSVNVNDSDDKPFHHNIHISGRLLGSAEGRGGSVRWWNCEMTSLSKFKDEHIKETIASWLPPDSDW